MFIQGALQTIYFNQNCLKKHTKRLFKLILKLPVSLFWLLISTHSPDWVPCTNSTSSISAARSSMQWTLMTKVFCSPKRSFLNLKASQYFPCLSRLLREYTSNCIDIYRPAHCFPAVYLLWSYQFWNSSPLPYKSQAKPWSYLSRLDGSYSCQNTLDQAAVHSAATEHLLLQPALQAGQDHPPHAGEGGQGSPRAQLWPWRWSLSCKLRDNM